MRRLEALITRSLPFVGALLARVRASPLGSRLARGFAWSTLGVAAARLSSLIAAVIVARLLGREDFGALGIIQTTVGMFQVLAGHALGLTASRYVGELRVRDAARAGRVIGLAGLASFGTGLVAMLALLALAPWLASTVLGVPSLEGILRLSAPLLLFGAINGAQMGALAGFEAFRHIATVNLHAGLATLPLVVGGALWRGVPGAVVGLVAATVVQCALSHRMLVREASRAALPITFRGAWSERAMLGGFTLPAILGGAMVAPTSWACAALLVRQPDGLAEMGLYNAANQWFAALLILPATLGQVVLPILAGEMSGNRRQAGRVLSLALRTNAAIVAPLVVLGALTSPLIMRMYGPSFVDGWPTLVVVLATAAVVAVQTPVGELIAASGRMWLGFVQNLGWALAFFALTLILVGWGAFGLASARLGAYVVHAVWTGAFAWTVIRHSTPYRSVNACNAP